MCNDEMKSRQHERSVFVSDVFVSNINNNCNINLIMCYDVFAK